MNNYYKELHNPITIYSHVRECDLIKPSTSADGWKYHKPNKKRKNKQPMSVIQRLLEKLCCKHEWELMCDTKHIDEFGGRYTRRTLVCVNCGKIKQITL